MSLKDILKIESDREKPESWNLVHLIKEGTFYHANDWSAWLLANFPLNPTLTSMNPNAMKMKDGTINVFVGFPATSMSKYIPEGSKFQPIDDNRIDVYVTLPMDYATKTFEEIKAIKEEWIKNLPISTKKNERENREVTEQSYHIRKLSDVASAIVSMPIEDMSPKEAWEELRKLRRDVAALF